MLFLRELAVAAVLAGSVNAMYPKSGDVLVVDYKNFKKEILDSDNAAVVEFYAPWCGHCKNLKPAYEKAAKSLKGLAKVAAMDCDDDSNRQICGEQGVQGFPTIKLFRPTGKKGKPAVEEYQGQRTAKAISDAVVERIPNHVQRVTGDKVDEFLDKDQDKPKAILFTTKGTTGALWKSLAIDFLGVMDFAQIRDKETAAVEKFGITKFPSIVLVPDGRPGALVYSGEMEKGALYDFFAAVKAPAGEPTSSNAEPKSKASTGEEASSPIAEPVVTEKRM